MRRWMIVWPALLSAGCGTLPTGSPEAPQQGTHAVVLDIDGTLTPHQLSIFDVRRDAARAVCLYAKKGYQIIYLSTRTKWFQAGIPGWQKRYGFPPGVLHLPAGDRKEDFDFPDEFKQRILRTYISKGWHIDYAYGDSHTDFVAYAFAKIKANHVFALQPAGATKCEPGRYDKCLQDWSDQDHLDYIRNVVPAVPAAKEDVSACQGN